MTNEILPEFENVNHSIWDGFRKTLFGDCNDFIWTYLVKKYGYVLAFLMITFHIVTPIQVYSPHSGLLPSHTILWVPWKGVVDMDNRYFRSPWKRQGNTFAFPLPFFWTWFRLFMGLTYKVFGEYNKWVYLSLPCFVGIYFTYFHHLFFL